VSEDEAAEMRALFASGVARKFVARRMGRSYDTVAFYTRGMRSPDLTAVQLAARAGMLARALRLEDLFWSFNRALEGERMTGKISDRTIGNIRDRVEAGVPLAIVARVFGLSLSTVYRHTADLAPAELPGARNAKRAAQAKRYRAMNRDGDNGRDARIRAALSEGVSRGNVCREFNISAAVLRRIAPEAPEPVVEVPGWVPAECRDEYRRRAAEAGEESAAAWARAAKRGSRIAA
jgi:transcriptional regulator with XRE-family HTH domain